MTDAQQIYILKLEAQAKQAYKELAEAEKRIAAVEADFNKTDDEVSVIMYELRQENAELRQENTDMCTFNSDMLNACTEAANMLDAVGYGTRNVTLKDIERVIENLRGFVIDYTLPEEAK
jgi:septal ring factor EnvC (AmiA/AmiB activator)